MLNPTTHSSNSRLTELLGEDNVDEVHIQAYVEALRNDDVHIPEANSPLPPGSPAISHHSSVRVRKVSALSDFAPINLRVKRRKKKGASSSAGRKHDWTFLLLRWPLLFLIFLFIAIEFGLYVLIRQVVNTKEWIFSWRGQKGVLRKRLRGAQTYQEWKDAAATLDQYLHFDEWKKIDEDAFYDWKLVRKVRRSLRTLREKKDARGCIGVLETCIRANFAGIESPRLYSETYIGTKDLIESYYDEQEKALEFLRESSDITLDEKKRFFKSANTNYGISALCLSGGASFGYYHFGVVKAFIDAKKLLPRVITGTSAGGLIAALVCTRTDDELKILLVPELASRLSACEDPFKVWVKRAWTTGARFDSIAWARKCSFFTRGSMTFKEAYLRTGRVLNISVIPADRHSPTKLLNYLTAPDTVIWSALLASAAVPGILNPVPLMSKIRDGSIVPWNWGSKWKDGSLRVDIPVQALNLYFNVTHPVVSQVNPHVHLFFFAPRGSAGKPVAHSKGKGWRGNFLLSAAEQALKHELTKNFKVIRDLELLPQLLGQDWSSVFLQRFDGAVTIWPRTRFWDWFRILTDPDPPELDRMMKVGQIVTFPKLHMIENRARIERQIFLGRQSVRRSQSSVRQTSTEATSLPARLSTTPPPTGIDIPLSVDTDAETAYATASRKYFRRRHQSSHGQLTPRGNSGGRGLSVRNSSTELVNPESTHDRRTEPMLNRTANRDDSPSGPMSRLPTRSLPTALALKEDEMDEDGWSSESSFNDDLTVLDEHPRHVSYSSLPPIEDADELQRDEWSG
ncbi:acyl transferase/acyl hydrolase/lysophospholipase [Lentinula boryana]|uniref:Patatin-like phospholipase domain-containing protein n=1 Tax=Lentinula boryana TaxID=40481 RepID=A0ABQ8QEX0_9AGAR|nr:acyl transferase/acyl hydrolase/lysophospholipase [Lentinula boryana]